MYLKWLREKIKKNNWGKKEFMLWRENNFGYNWLIRQVAFLDNEIKRNKIESGRICAVIGDYSPYSVALLLTLIENKNIVAPISSVIEEQKKYYCETSQSEFIFRFDEKGNFLIKKTDVIASHSLLTSLQEAGCSGLILFTSGSAGSPKAALYNFDKLLDNYFFSRKAMRSLVFLQLDHIGGINTLFSLLSNGGTMVIVEKKSPAEICSQIERFKVELFPTTPSFLNLLMVSEEYKNYDLSSLKLITYGTEVMPDTLLKKLNFIFPKVELKQTYGLTEVGILRTKSKASDSTWVKVGGENYQIKVVDGTLWIKSNIAILGYLNAPSPFTEDGWLPTRDRVKVEGEFIKFLGRDEEIINVAGLKVYPQEIEDIILQMQNVSDVIVFGEKNNLLGNIACAKVALKNHENLEDFRQRLYKFCIDKIERYKIPQKIEIVNVTLMNNPRFKKIRRTEIRAI